MNVNAPAPAPAPGFTPPSTSTSRLTGQPMGRGMGLFGKHAFKQAGVGGNSVSQHAASYAPPSGGNVTYQKQLVKAKTFNDKRQKSLEKKADGYRTKVQEVLLSEHPSSLANIFKLNHNLRKMEKTGLDWNYTATKDFGDLGAEQAIGMLAGLQKVQAANGVKTPNAKDALMKLEDELEAGSRTDANIESDELLEAHTAMLEAQAALNGATAGTSAHDDAKYALDRATQRHEAAQMRRDEPGMHATHSNMERATEAGEKLVKRLSDMHGKTPAQQKEDLEQLTGLLELAERANLYKDSAQFLTDRASHVPGDQVDHLLDIQGIAKGGDNAARAEMYAAFMYGVMAAVGDRHNAANTGTDVAKVFAKLSQGVADSVFAKLAEWKQPVAPVKAGGNAAAQPVRMNEAAGAYRDHFAQVAKDQVAMWFNDPQTVFSTFGPSLANLKNVPVTDWGDGKVDCTFVNGTKGIVDFSTFQGPLNAQHITDPANSKALRTHMAAQWVKSAIDAMNNYDANYPGQNMLRMLSKADRVILQGMADQAMAQVAPIATAASQAAAKARTEALKLELGAQAEFGGHYWVENNPSAFQAVVHTLGALATQDPKDLGSTKFAVVDGTAFGNGFHFDFTTMFHADIVAKNINPTSDEAKQLRNYMAARWIQGMLDHLKTVEILLPGHFNALNAATRSTIRKLADTAAPRPTAKPTPGVPKDWAQQLAKVEADVRTMMDQRLPDVPVPPETPASLEAKALALANELAAASGVTRNRLGSAPGMTSINTLVTALMPPADPDLIPAMRADMAATIIKTLMDEFDQRRRRLVGVLLQYNVRPALDAVTGDMLQKLHALTFAPNLQPESAWTFKLADTRKSAKKFMADLGTISQTNVNKAKQKLEFMVTTLNEIADKGMPWPLPARAGFGKIIDDLVPVEAPFDQVEQMSKDLATVFVQQLIEEIDLLERNLAPPAYFGTKSHRTAALKQDARDSIAKLKPGVDHSSQLGTQRTVANWSTTHLGYARTDAKSYWTKLKSQPSLLGNLGADLERLSTMKRGDLYEALKQIKDLRNTIDNCLPKTLPSDKDLLERMKNDLAAEFVRELATLIAGDTALAPVVVGGQSPDMLDKLKALRADTSLL